MSNILHRDPSQPVARRVDDLLACMTLAEKVGQMTQAEKNSVTTQAVTDYCLGSVLSGGGGYPKPNTPAAWLEMVSEFQCAALKTRLGIPLIYGVDAVHGHNNVRGATIFPHNISLGAARDPALVERIARATAQEMAATGVVWNFAPTVAVPQDVRWGRACESFGENTDDVTALGEAYVRGLQSVPGVAACAKHYIGDGGTTFGSSTTIIKVQYLLDQGDTRMDEARLRALFLPPYVAAIKDGVHSILISFSSWNGTKIHAHKRLLTDVLKGELGFKGFLVSDWGGVDQISDDYHYAVVTAVNAGLDMIMTPFDFKKCITHLVQAVEADEIAIERIDDAVRRILSVKFSLGLFEQPAVDPPPLSIVGCTEHRELAREAVRRSLVLLRCNPNALPVARGVPLIFVAGEAAHDIGLQCGGWTIEWLGAKGPITEGTTLLEGIRQAVSPKTRIEFSPQAEFDGRADVGIAVVGEEPYAEGAGDCEDLTLNERGAALIEHMRKVCRTLIVIVVAGRPVVLTEQLPKIDALIAAWLPGSEGAGVADVLFGDHPFTGKLPYSWPRRNDQLPFDFSTLPATGDGAPLFPAGHGL